jgi:hypothetical protein
MKKAMLTTTILVGTLLSGAGVAVAAPPFAGPTDVAAELPTDFANPTENPDPTVPADLTNPTENPDQTDPPETTEPPVTTTTQQPPVEQPKNPPSGVPTPNRIDTGAGPADPVNWWLIALPVLTLLGLAATGTWLVIQRSERRPS